MKNIKLILTAVIATFFTSCINDDSYSAPPFECEELTPTLEVAPVDAAATNTIQQHTADDVIEAYVTSSDEGGNFYKSISFVSLDNQKGFSIPVDDYNLYTKYPPGQKVYIKMKDIYFQKRSSQTRGLQIGAKYDVNVGRIAPISYRNVIKAACEGSVSEESIVNHLTIAQAKNDANLNKLIEFDAVQFTNASLGHTYFDKALNPVATWTATNHNIEDANGNTIIVRISDFASFSKNQVAEGSGKIRGVLTKYGSDWQFMVRNESDIKLTDDRFVIVNPNDPTPPTNLLFTGADFENWTTFTNSLNSFGLIGGGSTYAVQGVGTGAVTGNSLHLNGTPVGNDYVFTILASAHGNIPANPSTITFWVKGTSAKSLSLNVYRMDGTTYDVFNVGNLATTPATLTKAALQTSGNPPNGTNNYNGNINTDGQWVKITLDISDVNINTGTSGNLFALKVGKEALYNLHVDNIEIH